MSIGDHRVAWLDDEWGIMSRQITLIGVHLTMHLIHPKLYVVCMCMSIHIMIVLALANSFTHPRDVYIMRSMIWFLQSL